MGTCASDIKDPAPSQQQAPATPSAPAPAPLAHAQPARSHEDPQPVAAHASPSSPPPQHSRKVEHAHAHAHAQPAASDEPQEEPRVDMSQRKTQKSSRPQSAGGSALKAVKLLRGGNESSDEEVEDAHVAELVRQQQQQQLQHEPGQQQRADSDDEDEEDEEEINAQLASYGALEDEEGGAGVSYNAYRIVGEMENSGDESEEDDVAYHALGMPSSDDEEEVGMDGETGYASYKAIDSMIHGASDSDVDDEELDKEELKKKQAAAAAAAADDSAEQGSSFNPAVEESDAEFSEDENGNRVKKKKAKKKLLPLLVERAIATCKTMDLRSLLQRNHHFKSVLKDVTKSLSTVEEELDRSTLRVPSLLTMLQHALSLLSKFPKGAATSRRRAQALVTLTERAETIQDRVAAEIQRADAENSVAALAVMLEDVAHKLRRMRPFPEARKDQLLEMNDSVRVVAQKLRMERERTNAIEAAKTPFDNDADFHKLFNPDRGLNKLVEQARQAARQFPDAVSWNMQYQFALDLPDTEPAKYELVTKLSQDFVAAATRYGKTIISEIGLPPHQRTIKVSTDLGGVAGGKKFIVNGILFKLAQDVVPSANTTRWLYGGPRPNFEFAQKGAGHDLRGAIQYYAAAQASGGRADLRVPLQVIVDYRGYRLNAMPILPLKEQVYGSEDAGVTVTAKDPEVNAAMELMAEHLHLEGHIVGRESRVKLFTAGDVEAHIGTDGRKYLLDTARTFPPEALPSEGTKYHLPMVGGSSVIFYRQLRPELLQIAKQEEMPRLNSDSFSGWTRFEPNYKEHHQNVRNMTRYLFDSLVPAFAQWLADEVHSENVVSMFGQLNVEAHKRGINMRHLGLVLSHLPVDSENVAHARIVCLVEIMKRTLKNLLRKQLRHATEASAETSDFTLRTDVVRFLNLTTCGTSGGTSFWKEHVIPGIRQRFGDIALRGLDKKELHKHPAVLVGLKHIVQYVLSMVGMKLSVQCEQDLQGIESLHEFEFAAADVEEGPLRTKVMTVLSYSEGRVLLGAAQKILATDVPSVPFSDTTTNTTPNEGDAQDGENDGEEAQEPADELEQADAEIDVAEDEGEGDATPATKPEAGESATAMSTVSFFSINTHASQRHAQAAARLLNLSSVRFEAALRSNPSDSSSLRDVAIAEYSRFKVLGRWKQADVSFLSRMERIFSLGSQGEKVSLGLPMLAFLINDWEARRQRDGLDCFVHCGGASSNVILQRAAKIIVDHEETLRKNGFAHVVEQLTELRRYRLVAVKLFWETVHNNPKLRPLLTGADFQYQDGLEGSMGFRSSGHEFLPDKSDEAYPVWVHLFVGRPQFRLRLLGQIDRQPQLRKEVMMLMYAAVKRRQYSIAGMVQELGLDINAVDPETGDTELMKIARMHDIELLEGLVASGAQLDAVNLNGHTALELAIIAQNLPAVQELVRLGANIHRANADGVTPLMVAAKHGTAEMIAELLKYHVKIDAATKSKNETALMFAVNGLNAETTRALLTAGARTDLRDTLQRNVYERLYGSSAAMQDSPRGAAVLSVLLQNSPPPTGVVNELIPCISTSDAPELVKTILDVAGVHPDSVTLKYTVKLIGKERPFTKLRPLHFAILEDRIDVVKMLVDVLSASVTIGADFDWTPVHMAGLRDRREICRYLFTKVEPEQALSARSTVGWTPLHLACSEGQLPIVRLLIKEFGADRTDMDNDGWTCLHLAAIGGHVECCRALLQEFGSDVNQQENDGYSAIHFAAREGHAAVVRSLLLEFDADFTLTDNHGQTPLDLATEKQHLDAISMLKAAELRAESSRAGDPGLAPSSSAQNLSSDAHTDLTSLVNACRYGFADVAVQLLQRYDANPTIVEQYKPGRTPLIAASQSGLVDVVCKLLAEARESADLIGYDSRNALMLAVLGRHSEVVKLVAEHSNPRHVDSERKTALILAAERGLLSVAKVLMENGHEACISMQDGSGMTAIMHAAAGGHVRLTRLLLSASDLQLCDKEGYTVIHHAIIALDLPAAVRQGDWVDLDVADSDNQQLWRVGKIIKLQRGPTNTMRVRYFEEDGDTVVAKETDDVDIASAKIAALNTHTPPARGRREHALARGKRVLDILVEARGDKDSPLPGTDQSMISFAIVQNKTVALMHLMEAGCDPMAPDADGNTPLEQALASERYDVVDILLSRGSGGTSSLPMDRAEDLMLQAAERGLETLLERIFAAKPDLSADAVRVSYGMTLLSLVCARGNVAIARTLVEKGHADVNARDEAGRTPLMYGAMYGHMDVLKFLVTEAEADINAVNDRGSSALTYASDSLECLRYLAKEAGADVNLRNHEFGRTTLFYTVMERNPHILEFLLRECNADPDVPENEGVTAVMEAASDQPEAVRILVEGGADLNKFDKKNRSALSIALDHGQDEIVNMLVGGGADVNALDINGETLLTIAAAAGNKERVKKLLSLGGDPAAENAVGINSFSLALQARHWQVVEEILAHSKRSGSDMSKFKIRSEGLARAGISVAVEKHMINLLRAVVSTDFVEVDSIRDERNMTLLMTAASSGQAEVCDALLREGSANPDLQQARTGKTALHMACGAEHLNCVKVLVEVGKADLMALNRLGSTPLIFATSSPAITQYLVKTGRAGVNHQNEFYGKSALIYCAEEGGTDTVRVLLEHGAADVDLVDNDGRSAMIHAAQQGHIEILNLLVNESPNVQKSIDVRDKHGRTALSHACLNGRISVLRFLLGQNASPLPDEDGVTPLIAACMNGAFETARVLVDSGLMDLNYVDNLGNTALSRACQGGFTELALYLVDKGADTSDTKPLEIAIKGGFWDIVARLEQAHPDFAPTEVELSTAHHGLHKAAVNNDSTMARILLRVPGVDVDSKDEYAQQRTPLIAAIQHGCTEAALVFAEAGAGGNHVDSASERSAFQWACREGCDQVVEALLKNDATDVNFRDKFDNTPLILTAYWGRYGAAAALLSSGRDVDVRAEDWEKKNAFVWARERGFSSIMELIVNYARQNGQGDVVE